MDKQLTPEQIGVVKQCKNAGFVPDIAFTLTLDLDKGPAIADRISKKTKAESIAAKWLTLDPRMAQILYDEFEDMFKQVYEKVAKKCFGSNCKRLAQKKPSKELKMFGGTERTRNSIFHLHCAAILPEHVSFEDFKAWVVEIWSSFYIGSKQQYKFKLVDDVNGWIEYMSKDFHKNNAQGYISYSKL